MVELKNNKTAEELIQGIKRVIEEKMQKNQASIEDYIKCGEEELKKTHIDAVKSLGDLSKLIFGCISYRAYTFGKVEQMSVFDNTLPIGDSVFDKVDWSRLFGVSIDLLEHLGTRSRYSFDEYIQWTFGEKLGRQLMGLMLYYYYLSFLDRFESKANEDKNIAPLRSLYRFLRYEKINDVPFPYCNDERCMDKYQGDMSCECSEIEPEEREFVYITMDILKGKILEFYDRIKGQNLSDDEIEKIAGNEVFNFLCIPYIGFFDSLDSALGNVAFNAEYTDDFGESLPSKNDEQRFVKKIYRMFIDYIRRQKKSQLAKEREIINDAGKYIREAFDSCETIEQKMALAKAYALDKKSNMVANGLELLRILRIRPHHNWSAEERVLYHYVMSIYYARPAIGHIIEEDGEYNINLENDPRFNMRYLLAKAKRQRKSFEKQYIKTTFNSCQTIEQKLALAKEYALGRKNFTTINGEVLLSVLGMGGLHCDIGRLFHYYVLSISGAHDILECISNRDSESVDFAYNTGLLIRKYIDATKVQIIEFLKLCKSFGVNTIPGGDIASVQEDIDHLTEDGWVTSIKKIATKLCDDMGVTLQPSREPLIISAPSNALVDEIVTAMSIVNDGSVTGIYNKGLKCATYCEVEAMDGTMLGWTRIR